MRVARLCRHAAHQLTGPVRQNALLAEIIKVNAPNPQVLLNVINSMNMSPRLEEIPLPQGPSYAFLNIVALVPWHLARSGTRLN